MAINYFNFGSSSTRFNLHAVSTQRRRIPSTLKPRDLVEHQLEPNLPHLLIDKNRFKQVLVSLIKQNCETIDELKTDQQD